MTFAYLFSALDAPDDGPDEREQDASAAPSPSVSRLPPSDHAIVTRVRAGDRAAMNALVLAHFEGLARYAECLLHSRDDAEDVAQDVLARVWNHHAEWMPATSVQAYLLGAVRNRVIDMRRRVSSRARRDVQFQGEHPVALPPDALLSDAEEEAVLRNAIAQLSDRWREVIALRYEQQIAFREIGRILGISEDAAKKLARRAVAELRRSLGL